MNVLTVLFFLVLGVFAMDIMDVVVKSAISIYFKFQEMKAGWSLYIENKRQAMLGFLEQLERDRAALKGQPAQYKVRYPIAFHTVDAAITRGDGPDAEVLLIQKPTEVSTTYWRFPGGFVDPSDESAAHAAKREATEEVGGMETAAPSFICSSKVDDPRYRNSVHKIITSFYELPYLWGAEKAGDDAAKAEWKKLKDLKENPYLRNPIHEMLFQELFAKKGI